MTRQHTYILKAFCPQTIMATLQGGIKEGLSEITSPLAFPRFMAKTTKRRRLHNSIASIFTSFEPSVL